MYAGNDGSLEDLPPLDMGGDISFSPTNICQQPLKFVTTIRLIRYSI